jgi:hypothetical protein
VLPVTVVLVVVLALTYVSTISPAGLHTWVLMGDVDTAAALVVAGSLFFPAATNIACRLDRLGLPRISDHFKQCSLLYVVVIVGTVALVRGRDARGSVGYGVGGVVAVAASIGIIVNAITLLVRRWRARAI